MCVATDATRLFGYVFFAPHGTHLFAHAFCLVVSKPASTRRDNSNVSYSRPTATLSVYEVPRPLTRKLPSGLDSLVCFPEYGRPKSSVGPIEEEEPRRATFSKQISGPIGASNDETGTPYLEIQHEYVDVDDQAEEAQPLPGYLAVSSGYES
eukprot:m.536643 g.536643  ORF g.536643 m.536643 type:complete len:152 (-) comp57623_c0_seq10:2622-3077(-)